MFERSSEPFGNIDGTLPLRHRRRLITALGLLLILWTLGLQTESKAADLKLASYFTDHMVLQRDCPICIWGTGDARAIIQVSIASVTTTAIVGTNHQWRAVLAPVPAGGPYVLSVSAGDQTNNVNDVCYGDVWLCSGQSNMQMPVKECDPAEQQAMLGNHSQLRLCTVGKGWNAEPQTSAEFKWQTATPDSESNFSAVAYFFAAELLRDPALAGVPLAVMDSSVGGTMCEAWIPQASLAGFDPKDLHDSMFGIKPTMLYNSMIAPLGPAAFKGVIWYQGEGNSGDPETYPQLLSTLIGSWRKQFAAPRLPFFIVQLPDYAPTWNGYYWSWEREAQAKVAQTVPDTYLILSINTTDGLNLHPKQKLEIGRRAALLARRHVYGEDIVANGPAFQSARVEGQIIRVTFKTGGSALSNSAPGNVRGFMVAGADGQYHPAEARIVGQQVLLQCDQVPSPKTVRYAWAGVPNSSLVNSSSLPAAPFRTDNFPASKN